MENLCFCFFLLLALSNAAISQHPRIRRSRVCIFYVSKNPCNLCDCVSNGMTFSVNCQNRRLMHVPGIIYSNATSLDLRTNCIRKLQNDSFTGLHNLKKLDISNNNIDVIEIGTFWPLKSLEELRLGKTNLGLLQRALKQGTFRGLKNLKSLNLQNNAQQSLVNASRLPDKTFSDLVGLEDLQIDGSYNFRFGPGFENLINFKTLTMSGWDGYCEMVRLESQTFLYLPYLQNINIINCKLNYIDPDAFRPLKNLQTLDLSVNENLGFESLARLLQSLKYTSTRILNITSIVSPNEIGSRLSRYHVQDLQETKLEEVYMDKNAIEVIDYGVLSKFPPTLRKLSLRQNRLVFTLFMYEIFNLGNLLVFDGGNQQPSISDQKKRERRRRFVDNTGATFQTFGSKESLSTIFTETRKQGKDIKFEKSAHFKRIFKTESIRNYFKQRNFQIDSLEEDHPFKDFSVKNSSNRCISSKGNTGNRKMQNENNMTDVRKETLEDKSNLLIQRRKRSVTISVPNRDLVTAEVQMTTLESSVPWIPVPNRDLETAEVKMTTMESSVTWIPVPNRDLVTAEVKMATLESSVPWISVPNRDLVTAEVKMTTLESSVPRIPVPNRDLVAAEVQMTTTESSIPRIALKTYICSGSKSNFVLLDFNGVENNITHMDISGNEIPQLQNLSFAGLSRLEFLNLSSNQIVSVESGTFAPLQSLIYLDLSNDQLQNSINKNLSAYLFETVSNLQILNISKNSIAYLPPILFQSLHHAKVLDVNTNDLKDFNVNLANLTELQNLDLSNNHLSSLEAHIMDYLDNIAKNHSISLDLSGNKMFCTCKTLPFLRWLKETKVNLINRSQYYCSLENGTIQYLNKTEFLRQLEESCKSYLLVYISAAIVVTFILASIIFFLAHKHRWKLRYLYHMAKLKLPTKPIPNAEDVFINDSFISYADEDVLFVKNCVIQELEVNRGHKLVVSDRDFLPGEVLTTAILRAIRESKKTISLMSKASLKNKWWVFELHMAQMESIHTKRDVLIIVLLENIASKDLPLDVLNILQSSPSIDYPKDKHAQIAFWIKLHEYLKER